jgi:hypothetical protein
VTPWVIAAAAGALTALLQYGAAPGRAAVPALLRAAAVALVVALLLDAPLGGRRAQPPFAALDASASWLRAGDSAAWLEAGSRLRRAGADSTFLFGDSLRRAAAQPGSPVDASSAVRPAVERALAAGRALVVVTDGELDDPSALGALPPGSRVDVVPRRARPDAAVAALEAPRAAVGGDTVEMRARLVAGGAGAPAGSVALLVGGRRVAAEAVEALAPFAERALAFRARVPDEDGEVFVRAVWAAPGDGEPRNDTLTTTLDVSAAAAAVFVSTSPDYDARYALEVLRGALSLPTRGYLRVAPGNWRVEGTLAPIAESEVRRIVRAAPLVILHGDTLALGRPRDATRGAVALLVPPREGSADWYAVGAPASPIAAALAGIAWDSLPPIAVGPAPRGSWDGLEVREGRRGDRRVPIAGTEGVRRSVVVAAAGLWRWQFRGGATADAYATLWGSLFDWLAAERSDLRAALPADAVVRAGEPVRWRRGGAGDSTVVVALARRGGNARADSVTLHFPDGATIAEGRPLAAGVYDVRVRGGSTVLAVNASRELLPRQATVQAGRVGAGPVLAEAPRLRAVGWAYAIALALLCAEWLARRRLGLR